MKKILIFPIMVSLSACVGSTAKTYTLPETLGGLNTSAQLACRYEKQTDFDKNLQTSNWYFWRQDHRTETRDQLSNQGEIWEHNTAGDFFYTRLFYNEHVALEFVQGDLATADTKPSLQQLTSLVDPNALGKELAFESKDSINGLPVENYRGTIKHVVTEVDWLPSLQLPARLVKELPTGTVTLTLAECTPDSKFTLKPITKAELDGFRHLDYTDLGDMEDDPMVQHIEQLMGGHHHE